MKAVVVYESMYGRRRAGGRTRSFLVDKDNHLEPVEEERAVEWGARLEAAVSPR